MQAILAMLALRHSTPELDGPDAAPSNVNTYLYSSPATKIGISWTNGDNTAQTDVSIDGGSSVYTTVPAGIAQYDTGLTSGVVPAVRHTKNGITTDWVGAV